MTYPLTPHASHQLTDECGPPYLPIGVWDGQGDTLTKERPLPDLHARRRSVLDDRHFGRLASGHDVVVAELREVVGRSGSGKSTLLHCLAGILAPDSGPVRFRGERLDRWSERRRSDRRLRHVGLVFRFGDLVPELSLADNVRLPLLLAKADRAETGRRIAEVLERLEIADVAGRRPGEVSGGQQQRAAIARALVHRPAVVLADEPTGALDTTTGQLVLEALLLAARQQDSAVVLVTHEVRLSSYCDREITLCDGAIVEPART